MGLPLEGIKVIDFTGVQDLVSKEELIARVWPESGRAPPSEKTTSGFRSPHCDTRCGTASRAIGMFPT